VRSARSGQVRAAGTAPARRSDGRYVRMRESESGDSNQEAEMKVVHCPCGVNVEGESDDELVQNVEAHIASDHPDMVGNYSREQILEMAHEH